jgi:signal transduction histidine kinase
MRLSQFLLDNLERILQSWEDFARTLSPGRAMGVEALRNDLERMLRFVAADIETPQSGAQQLEKPLGRGPQPDPESAAQAHGLARLADKFSLAELVSEFRALRASITKLWMDEGPKTYEAAVQLIRCNEAIDQILAESVVRYVAKAESDADLFSATISHDMRAPLHAVSVSAMYLAASDRWGEAERSAVRQITHSVERMAVMLRELADFTRVRLNALVAYERRPCDVTALCREAVEETATANPACAVEVLAPGSCYATVDEGSILQLMSNLLSNAVQHGSANGRIRVSVACEDESIVIEVTNPGRQIPAEELPHVFEPLFRGSGHREATGSLGLGLYIARTIAVAHGGDIDVASSESETTFTVRLPRTAERS